MNLRYEILRAVSKNPGAPAAEICDVIDYDRQKTTWSVRDCAKAGLLAMRRDDVTGQPGYTLTEAGKERLADGPTKQGGNAKHSHPAVEQNTGSSASGSLSPSEGAAVQSKPAPVTPPQYDPRSVAFSASTRLEAEKDEEYSLLGLLADIRAAAGDPEGKLMQDELVEHIRAIYDLGEAHKRACLAWESAMMAAVGEDGVNDALKKIVDLQNKICMKDAELFKQSGAVVELRNLLAEERTARMALQEQVEELQREAMRGASLLSGSDRYTAAGYLVRASKRKPRALQAADKAREAALGAIRAGAARAEVFALVPVGQARRGAEWRSA